ncbi:MAG TPA: Type 1 glutamine amidotransferase-like domain-containing protein [Actinomycetota bacterium]|jgi:cyanophycinase
MSRSLAFLGSGEFEPWSEPVERMILAASRNPDGVVLVSPAAAAHEGDASFDMWAGKGLQHYGRLGIRAEVLPLKTREDAHRDDVTRRLDDAAAVFFSGGNPARLSEIVTDTPFWRALAAAQRDGLPYAGCSAGVACLTERTYDSDATDPDAVWARGIGFVTGLLFGPHWDIVDTWMPGASELIVSSVPPNETFVGLDEETAMVGDGRRWNVVGRSKIHVLRAGEWERYADGDVVDLELAFADDTS